MPTPRHIDLNKQLVQGWSYDDVLRVTESHLSEFNLVNCTTALSRLAKAAVWDGDRERGASESSLLTKTAELVEELGSRCPPQNLANALHACERLGLRGKATEALACAARCAVADAGRLKAFSGQHLANVAWACAKLGNGSFGPFAAALTARARDLNAQELSMAAWALATGCGEEGEGGEAIAALTAAAFSLGVRSLSSQQLATLAWACAKLGHHDKAFLEEVAQAAPPRMRAGEFNEQDLANCAWAFGRLEHPAPELVAETSRRVDLLLGQQGRSKGGFSPQQLAMLAWAFSRLSGSAATVKAILQEAHRRLPEFSPRDLTDLVWAMAKAEVSSPDFLQAAGVVAQSRHADFNSQELLKFLGAFRRAGGSSSILGELASAQRTLEYTFPGLNDLKVVLTAETPGQRPGSGRRRTKRGAAEDGHEGDPQRSDGGTTGVALWEASFVLAEWLSRQSKGPRSSQELASVLPKKNAWRRWSGKQGVELGAGLGLPSIIAAHLGVEMAATDGDAAVLRLLRTNCERNSPNGDRSLRAESLLWGSEDPLQFLGLKRPPDLLLAADVVYASAGERLTQMLTETLLALTDQNTLVLMSNVRRFPVGHPRGEERFFAALERVFTRTTLPVSALHSEHRRSGAGGCTVHALRRRPSVLPRSLPQGAAAINSDDMQSRTIRKGAKRKNTVAEVTSGSGKRRCDAAVSVHKRDGTSALKKKRRKGKPVTGSALLEGPQVDVSSHKSALEDPRPKKKMKMKRSPKPTVLLDAAPSGSQQQNSSANRMVKKRKLKQRGDTIDGAASLSLNGRPLQEGTKGSRGKDAVSGQSNRHPKRKKGCKRKNGSESVR